MNAFPDLIEQQACQKLSALRLRLCGLNAFRSLYRRDREIAEGTLKNTVLRSCAIGTAVVLLALCWPQETEAQQVVDKMVATVNAGVRTELITYSDLVWQLALQPNTPLENPSSLELNHALRLLIDQRLILQEADKLPSIAPTPREIIEARDELVRNFASASEFQRRLQRVGLTSEKLDEIIDQRLRMEKYLDFRFRSFVVISQQEIADYYRDIFVPRLKARSPGQIVPTMDEAKSMIEKTLMEAKIESDTDSFLDTARDRAEIVMLNPIE